MDDAQVLSGALGVVIIPDQPTVERAYSLASEILPGEAEYVLSPGSIPHLTLYHAKLQGLPRAEMREILGSIRKLIVQKAFWLGKIVGFGGNFVYWNVDQAREDCKDLDLAHAKALSISRFLDRSLPSKATSEEGLTLSEEQLENVRLYGHPLVGNLFTPHITLMFGQGTAQKLMGDSHLNWRFSVASVELVRVGHPGRIEELVDLEQAP